MKLTGKVFAAALAGVLTTSVALAQQPTFFRIGTGSAGGTYFPIGGTIANGISSTAGLAPLRQKAASAAFPA